MIEHTLDRFDELVTHPIRNEAFNARWYPNPTQISLPNTAQAQITVPGFDDTFEAWVLSGNDGTQKNGYCIVGAPGLSKGTSELQPFYQIAARLGIPMIGVIPQSHAGSPESKNKLATYGQGGSPEIVAAMDYAEKMGLGYRFIGVGVSHGSAVVAAAGIADRRRGNERLREYSFMAPAFSPRRAILAAAPGKVSRLLSQNPKVPEFLHDSPATALTARRIADMGLLRLAMQHKINLREINLERRIIKGQLGAATLQILHNADDRVIPAAGSDHISRSRGDINFGYFARGGHVDNWTADPAKYIDAIAPFLDRVVNGR